MSHETSFALRAGDGAATGGCPGLAVHGPDSPGRLRVERFVTEVYRRHFDASVPGFAPVLVALEDETGIAAAAGYRLASRPLHLERYLTVPIEAAISAAAGSTPERWRIAEVGHLSSRRTGAGRRLMALLALHLAGLGVGWVTVTATAELRAMFARIGVRSLELAVADPRAVGFERSAWGRYYDHAPRVLAGELRVNLDRVVAARRR
jgi:hypothetical protein